MFSRIRFAFLSASVVLLLATVAFGQTTGTLEGVVRDTTGALVAGASVKITNTETGASRVIQTNENGLYVVTNLQPGPAYQVEVSATGFETKTVKDVAVRLGTGGTVNVELSVGGVSGVVVVTGDAALINSTESQLSTSYSQRQLQELPYGGGSIDNLALLTPGVITPGSASFTNGVGISSNGNRGRSNNFQLDGQDNNDNSVAGPTLTLTNSDAIGDYQITTNNPSAEFGRNAGAQVNVITKAGTNGFHGTVSNFYQGSALNTSNNINKQTAKVYNFLADNGFPQLRGLANRNGKSPFSYNRFGGTLGGPIKKDRAFFFATFQADITNGEFDSNNLGSGGLTFTPESVRTATALGFPGAGQILGSTLVGGGPTAVQLPGSFYVVPQLQDTDGDGVPDAFLNDGGAFTNSVFVRNAAGGLIPLQTGEAIRILPGRNRQYQFITREDFNLTDEDNLTIRYIYDSSSFPLASGSALNGAAFDVPSKNNNFGATYTRLINPTNTNEVRFSFSRLDVRFGDPDGERPGPGIGFAGQRDRQGNFGSLGFGTANTFPQSRQVDVYQVQDTYSTQLGNHGLRAGIDFRHQKVNNFFLPNFLGVYRFAAAGAVPAAGAVCPLCTFYRENGTPLAGQTALAFENLLLGRPDRITFALGDPNIKTTQNDYFFFLQDNWKVRPNLTLNLGIRYEVSTTPFNPIIDRVSAREADASTAIFNSAFPLETRTTAKLPIDKNNFAPRVGFAWSPNFESLGSRFTNGRTVVRGGFGIAYDPSFFNIVLNTVTAAPFAAAGFISQTPGAAGSVNFPFLPATTAELNLTPGTNGGDPRLFNQTRVDPGFYSPYTLQWNFGVQQEVFKDSVFEVRYVGSKIVGQFQTVNGNPSIRFFNNAAQCLGVDPGAFTGGAVVGSPATTTAAACAGTGFQNRAGTNGNGRIDPAFGVTRLRTNGASSNYHGLQTRFDTRLSDLVFNANYTFSKTIDNASEIFSTFGGGQSVADPQNPFDSTDGERGLSAFHQKHSFTANFIYELPIFKDQRGFVGKLLGGFQASGIILLGSGRPYTPTQILGNSDPGFDGAFFSGVGSLRPYNGNPNAPVGTIAFGYEAACSFLFGGTACNSAVPGNFIIYNTLNTGSAGTVVASAEAAAREARLIYNDSGLLSSGANLADLEAFNYFKTPFGIGRNTFLGDNTYTVNFALFKTTRVSERLKVELRGEATNLFNSRNFGTPDPLVEDAFNGIAVSSFQNPGFNAGANRSLRFGLKLIF
ncbi:MAG: carboxypeptidase-like regulatory domain-containing protein [Pyrinomonadaceae bacterium]